MFVKTMTWYTDPAAPWETPALACRSRVAQPGAPAADGGAPACADDPDEAGADEAGVAGAEDAAADEAAEEGADAPDTDVVAEDTGGAEDELPTAHPARTAPAAATPASLSNNEMEPVITNHPF